MDLVQIAAALLLVPLSLAQQGDILMDNKLAAVRRKVHRILVKTIRVLKFRTKNTADQDLFRVNRLRKWDGTIGMVNTFEIEITLHKL